jgi:hypothetical protein
VVDRALGFSHRTASSGHHYMEETSNVYRSPHAALVLSGTKHVPRTQYTGSFAECLVEFVATVDAHALKCPAQVSTAALPSR